MREGWNVVAMVFVVSAFTIGPALALLAQETLIGGGIAIAALFALALKYRQD
jgi:hypothetical protein